MSTNQVAGNIAGRYRVTRELGAGAMATVYLADDVRHGRPVALKVLRPELAASLGTERFLREITITANLRHPHILPLYDSGEQDGMLFYVMPYVEGESLRERIARERQLPVAESLRLADEIADALDYAHSRGIVHRDIKPENILIENGRAVVADFGIAHAVNAAGNDKLTGIGIAVGTPIYMSPEQCTGDVVDARSDLYALGCVLYEMLAGTPPFTGPNMMAIIARHMTGRVPPLSTVRSGITPVVADAIERALAKSPADRFPTLSAWRDALHMRPDDSGRYVTGSAASAPRIQKRPPSFGSPMLGRDALLAGVIEHLRSGARILTLTGVGGTGKTRLAVELFGKLDPEFRDGAAFISMASVTDAADVLPTLAATLDVAEAHGRSALEALVTLIGDRAILLVIDNLEQVVEASTDIASLVSRCPKLVVVATSRRPLKVGSEVEVALPPLDVPTAGAHELAELLACPSVALFVHRAERVKLGFALSATNADSIAAICRSLDGLPLALELAAARVRILEPAALLGRLDHALDLLTSGDRDLPLRQRTLRATISWSYSLLSAAEQRTLRRLSVFHEGWTFDAMEQACYEASDRARALDDLESLVEKGLVRVVGGGERYSLLETIRAFAAEQLHAGGEVDNVRNSHAEYFLAFAREVDAGIQGATQLAAMARARAYNANLFAALGWLVMRARAGDGAALESGMRLCGWLGWYWHIVGLHLVAEESVTSLLALARDREPSLGRAVASFTSGMISANTGKLAQAIEEWDRMAADGRAVGDDCIASFGCGGRGYALLGMGDVVGAIPLLDAAIAHAQAGRSAFLVALMSTIKGMALFVNGDADAGRALVQDARRTQARIGDYEGGGMALSFLASMTFASGDFRRAIEQYRDAESAFATVGDKPELARVQCEMGYASLAANDLAGARQHFRRALRTYDENGSPRGLGQALIGLAAVEAGAGNPTRAVEIATAAQVMSERAGVVVEHPMAPGVAERIAALRATIPPAELDALQRAGGSLTPAHVLAMAS